MSDLYTVLRQSILDRNLRSASARQEIYSQARTAVIRQLWTYDPPLNESEIQLRIDDFDAAVVEIERDIERTFAETRNVPKGRKGKPRPQAADRGSVYEGYDEASDYASSIPARQPAREPERDRGNNRRGRNAPPATPEIDQASLDEIEMALSARSSAIERALRNGGDEPEHEPADLDRRDVDDRDDAYPPYDEDLPAYDDRYAAPPEEPPYPGHLDEDHGDHADDPDSPARDEEPRRRSRRQREPRQREPINFSLPKWGDISEPARIRVLLGAIGVLLLVLIVLAVILLTRGSASPTIAADPVAPVGTPVAVAAGPGASPPPPPAPAPSDAIETFVVFDGRDPTIFQSASGNPVRFEGDTNGGFARVSSSAADAGVRVAIGPGLAGRLAGRNIRLTITARSARENGAVGMRFAYQSGIALSPWQSSNMSPDFTAMTLTWRAPAQRTDPNGDYILIEPGIPGDGTGVDVRGIRIDVLS